VDEERQGELSIARQGIPKKPNPTVWGLAVLLFDGELPLERKKKGEKERQQRTLLRGHDRED